MGTKMLPEEKWFAGFFIFMVIMVLCALGILGWGVVEIILWIRRQD